MSPISQEAQWCSPTPSMTQQPLPGSGREGCLLETEESTFIMTLPYKYGITKIPANVTPISQMILSAFPLEFPVGNSDPAL